MYKINSIKDKKEKLFIIDKTPGKLKPTIKTLSTKNAEIMANIDHPNNR